MKVQAALKWFSGSLKTNVASFCGAKTQPVQVGLCRDILDNSKILLIFPIQAALAETEQKAA